MANLQFITDQLATGGDLPWHPEGAALAALREWQELGVTHIVDNRLEWSDEDLVAEHAPGLHYLHNGVDDVGGRQPDEWFDRGSAWIRAALEDPQAKVLVHCHMGINRGPSLALAALLDLGLDVIEAMDAVRTARPIAGLGYAEDALDWQHRRSGAGDDERRNDRRRLRAWRLEHPLDVVRIIRSIRDEEAEQAA